MASQRRWPEQHRLSVPTDVIELLFVHVPGENEGGIDGAKTVLGLAQAGDVDPLLRRRRARVHEERILVPHDQGQPGEKRLLLRADLRARPRDRRLGIGVQRVVGTPQHGGVMVSQNHDRALGSVPLDQVEHGDRIGAIAHQITEERVALRAQGLRVSETGRECLEIAVDVGEERQLHRNRVQFPEM